VAALYHRLGIFHVGYLGTIVLGVVSAIVIARQPRNPMGGFLGGLAVAIGISVVPFTYGVPAYLSHRDSWPAAQFALWLDAWLWTIPFGIGTPLTLVRLPDGRVPGRQRLVSWLAITGTALLALWAALSPGPMFPFGLAPNPVGLAGAGGRLAASAAAGLLLITIASAIGLMSVVIRYRSAGSDERQQIKWIALAGVVLGLTVVYTIVANLVFGQPLLQALIPFSIAGMTGPVAIGFAILRYRLYDIDLIINRALVYGTLTAILAGVYAGGVTLLQRLYLLVSGQKSDAALVITAFAIAVLFSPVRDRLQQVVDRGLGGADPVQALNALSANVQSVVRVMDAHRAARRLVDVAVDGYQARFGAIYLDDDPLGPPFYTRGKIEPLAALELRLQVGGGAAGRFALGPRRSAQAYSDRDRMAIVRSLEAVGEALSLGFELGRVHSARLQESTAETEAI
jgi:hypothetical protein